MQTTCCNISRWVKKPLKHLLFCIHSIILEISYHLFLKIFPRKTSKTTCSIPRKIYFCCTLMYDHFKKNYDKLCELIHQLPTRPHLIGLSETKIKHQPLLDISLPNYNFIHAASPTNAGGVGLCISDSLNYEILGTNSIHTSGCESLFIKLPNSTSKHLTTIGVIYRHPKNNIAQCTDELSKTLDSYLYQPHDLALVGDFNINLDPEKRQTEAWHYLETL